MTPLRRIAIVGAVILVVAGIRTTAFATPDQGELQCGEAGCWEDGNWCVSQSNACVNNNCKCDEKPQCSDIGVTCETYGGVCDGTYAFHVDECHNVCGGLGYCGAGGPSCVGNEGNDCTNYNACGMPGSAGTIQCDGSCSAGAAPPNSACNQDPKGSFDVADCTAALGWTFDPDYAGATSVHIYMNAQKPTGTFGGAVPANRSRPDVEQFYAVPLGYSPPNRTNSGWSWTIPAALKDGQPHQIWAYAVNVNSAGAGQGIDPPFGNNPRTITCPDPPTGGLSSVTCGSASGSATDPQGSPVQVLINNGQAPTGTQIGSGPAGPSFTIPFPPFTDGQTHNIYAYAQDIPSGIPRQIGGPSPVTCGPTVSLSANPTTVTYGGASTLTWSVSNATNCTASPGGWFNASSLFNGVANSSGSSGPLVNATTFTLTCTNATGQAVSATANVAVNIPPPTANIVSITDTNYCQGAAGMNITWAGESAARPIAHYQVQVLNGSGSVIYDTGQTVYAQAEIPATVAVSTAAPRMGLSRLLGQFVAAISSFIR